MNVTINIKPENKSTLATVLGNIPQLMTNLSGGFKCDIHIDANFK